MGKRFDYRRQYLGMNLPQLQQQLDNEWECWAKTIDIDEQIKVHRSISYIESRIEKLKTNYNIA